ncbi:MAG: hypothetical protein LBO76_05480, partial [Treponema sp.]|nr:hypothetical protein [Treponema sp.]
MFVKLLRYEFKALMRVMLALYLVLLALALVTGIYNRIVSGGNFDQNTDSISLIWVVAVSILFIVNIVTVITRFRDNLLKDEGYLMFTLPVPEWALVASKAAAALCTFLLSAAACIVFLTVFTLINNYRWVLDILPKMPRLFSEVVPFPYPHISSPPPLIVRIVMILVLAVQQVCLWYTAAIAGQIAPRFRSFAAFGTYVAVMILKQYLFQAAASQQVLAIVCIETACAVLFFWAASWLFKHRF